MKKEVVYDQYNAAVKDLDLNDSMSLDYFEKSFWPRVQNGVFILQTKGVEITKSVKSPCLILNDNEGLLAIESEFYRHSIKNNFSENYSDLRQSLIAILVSDITEKNNIGNTPIRIFFGEPRSKVEQSFCQMARDKEIQIRQI
jgi:hypothetical protein